MLMPMVWTNDFDDMIDDFADDWYDPFEDVVSLVAPDKEEIQTEKSIDRHNRKLANRYNKMLRHEWNACLLYLQSTDEEESYEDRCC